MLHPVSTIPDQHLAMAASMLNELRERVIDQVIDLPIKALTFHPQETNLSIGVLVVHLVWAEAGWIQNMTGCGVPPDLRENINDVGQAVPEGIKPPAVSMDAGELTTLCRRIGDEVTIPALTQFNLGYDAVIETRHRTMTPRGVLMHLNWHWTYHSAHIGLLRELWGSDYTWTFGSLGA
jgi:uncharacterized damage-inducible protein DinB